jgi:shikimate dehydrogenase
LLIDEEICINMMISGTTQKVGIIGWPVGHSFSPAIHNAAFVHCKLDYVYVPLPVEPGQLAQAVNGLRALGFIGANVTIPHKVAIMKYLDEIDETAQMAGAVNTIAIRQSKLIGYNTDANGFMTALEQRKFNVRDKRVLVIGAGGAARGILAGMASAGVENFFVAARHIEQARQFIHLFPQLSVHPVLWPSSEFQQIVSNMDVIIHATPIGMYPHLAETPLPMTTKLKQSAVVCDLIYNPVMTQLLIQANAEGHSVMGGLSMLVEQAALAFECWTGQVAPRVVMKQVAGSLFPKK